MVRKNEKNSEVVAIFYNYKNILDYFINSSDPKFLNWLRPIDQRLYNALRSKNDLTSFLEKNYLDENVLALNRLSELAPKTGNSELHYCDDIIFFGLKNRRI